MKYPPLHALMCFEAAARLTSMKQAAQELCVTPGAISQQIAKLEALLNVRLFMRNPRHLALTPEGRAYLQSLRPAFDQIALATQRMMANAQRDFVTLSCTSGFATQWLLPRLAHFEQRHPGIEVRIGTGNRIVDLHGEAVDFAVRHGMGQYPDLEVVKLLDDGLISVCRPDVLVQHAIHGPQDLARCTLLHDEHRLDWALWFRAQGLEDADTQRGPVFVDSNGVIDAALAGQGIALVRQALVEKALMQGTLVNPFPAPLTTAIAYYLVYPASSLLQPCCRLFRDWLVETAQRGQWATA